MKKAKRILSMLLVCLLLFSPGSTDVFAGNAPADTEELVNYFVADPIITSPGTQTVMLGIGDASTTVLSAGLSYRNQKTDQVCEAEAAELSGGFVLFRIEFPEGSQPGSYQFERITYTTENGTFTASFEEMGIEAAFGVDTEVESEPDGVLLTDEEAEAMAAETEMSIVSLDENGNPASGETMEQALEKAGCVTMDEALSVVRKGAGLGDAQVRGMTSLKVVLDAGHGGNDPGTQANGIVEKNANLKIAQYCKEELESYSGVIVYMTRTSDKYLTLAQRAQVAINKKADLLLSLHNNSNTSPGPCGANVYYPNSNYNANVGKNGRALANIIQSKLTALGLASGGIHIRNSENSTKYPDGSLADYYGVIKRCKENGIPALIVEHAFISNASDAKNYLTTDAQLKRLGVADAAAVAEYYGLSKGLGFNSICSASGTTMDLSWSSVVGVTGYSIARSTSNDGDFKEVANISPASKTTWRDTGLAPGTTYYYKIRTYTKEKSNIKYGKYSAVASGTTMATPTISSIKGKDSKTLQISWNTINDAANYELYRAKKKNGKYKKIATLAGVNQISYTDKVSAGKLYYYKIRSVSMIDNTTVYSDYSEAVPARTAVIPTKVSVRSEGTRTLRVSWAKDPNASGFVIKRADSANGKYKKIATVKDGRAKYYDDATVKKEKTYYYKVQSMVLNSGVKGVSGFGSSASGKTIKKTEITKIAIKSATSQKVSWKKVKGIDGYVLYQSSSKNGKYKKIAVISGAGKTSYNIKGLTPGTRYYYKVRTRKKVNGKFGYGSYSTARDVWSGEPVTVTSVQGKTANSLQVFWNPVRGVAGYNIYRSDSANGAYSKIAAAKDTDVSYTDTNLNMTKTYFYKIEAIMAGYKTTASMGMGAVASGSPVSSTSITSVMVNSQGQPEIFWNPVLNVTGYQIYRSTEESGIYSLIQTVSDPAAKSYTDTLAGEDSMYYYKVALVSSFGNQAVYGPQSNAVSVVLPAVPVTPATPQNAVTDTRMY